MRHSILDIQHSTPDIDIRYWTVYIRHLTYDIRHTTFDIQQKMKKPSISTKFGICPRHTTFACDIRHSLATFDIQQSLAIYDIRKLQNGIKIWFSSAFFQIETILRPMSCAKFLMLNVKYRMINVECQMCNVEYPISNFVSPMSNVLFWRYNIRRLSLIFVYCMSSVEGRIVNNVFLNVIVIKSVF